MRLFRLVAPMPFVALCAVSLPAQVTAGSSGGARFALFGDVIMSEPKGDFAAYVDRGFGVNLGGLLRVDPAGMLSVRAEIGATQYGSERMPVAFDFTGRIAEDIVTTNIIGWVGIGPQFTFPAGPIRPYANAAFAITNFRTTSAIEDRQTSERFGATDNASDYSSAVVFGGGVYIPFSALAPTAMLTLGGRYYSGGEATYLPEGGIRDNDDGSVTLSPARTKTDFVIWQLGVSVGIQPRRR